MIQIHGSLFGLCNSNQSNLHCTAPAMLLSTQMDEEWTRQGEKQGESSGHVQHTNKEKKTGSYSWAWGGDRSNRCLLRIAPDSLD